MHVLLEDVESLELDKGLDNAMSVKLEAALVSIENDRPSALSQLGEFINQVEAKRGTDLTDEEADATVAATQAIIDAINAGG